MSEKMEHSNTTVSSGESELSHSICVCMPFSYSIRKSGYGLLPANSIWQGAGGPATSQMRCWLLRRHKLHILRFRAKRESSSIPLRLLSKSQSRCWIAILCFLRTSVQRGLLLCCRAHTRSRGAKPHTAATRASRRGAGARSADRVDRGDFFHGGKIGTIGPFQANQPLSVALSERYQNSVFP